jgi:hypothetical protein
MNDPTIINIESYPSFISYDSGVFSLTPMSGDVGTFIFLIKLVDQFYDFFTVDIYFQIKIDEN